MNVFGNFFGKLAKLSNRISPPMPVGGLHITDSALRYVVLRGGVPVGESIRLQPGVVEAGKVKSNEVFLSALKELRSRVASRKKPVSVVLTLPMRDVYIQIFSTPKVAENGFREAANLNAMMISPIDINDAYYSWQKISGGSGTDVDSRMLGAFIQKDVADGFVGNVETAGFTIAAVEFESLSLSRSINFAKLVDAAKPYLIVEIVAEGIIIVIVKEGIPHFHYFHSWSEVQGDGKTISTDNFKKVLGDELVQVVNFYSTHWTNETLNEAVVITPIMSEEVSKLISDRFGSISVKVINPSSANAAIGAAFRGTVPRHKDTDISLASFSAFEVFEKQQVKNFVRVWRNVFVVSFGLVLAIFVGLNIFLRSQVSSLAKERDVLVARPSADEFAAYSQKAQEFNGLVDKISKIKSNGVSPSSLLYEIDSVAGNDINLTRVSFSPSDSSVFVNGSAPDEASAVAFKNRLVGLSQLYDVNIPLQNISDSENGVSFSLSFKIRSFNFGE